MKSCALGTLNCSKAYFNSEIIPIPDDVVQYLLSDGIVLPRSAKHGCTVKKERNQNDRWDIPDEDEIDWDSDEEDESKIPNFPEFEKRVQRSIKKLGGKVFPKLNWSAPRDATWVAMNNSLMCKSLGDVLLLLKSSDFITHDLTIPFSDCDNSSDFDDVAYELVLRQWHDIQPGMEFRCFVKNKTIIAISQRSSAYYPFIKSQEDELVEEILKFHDDIMKDKFPDSDYVFDTYRHGDDAVCLIDINPYGATTDPLHFTWDRIRQLASECEAMEANQDWEPAVGYYDKEPGVQPNELHAFAMPQDFVDLSRGEDPLKMIDFLKLQQQGNQDDSSSDENS
ncbi:translation initiation factor eIF2 assembly protein-like isoform X2 [Lineus longissimus]|uniref:translation initiation factor eIF2 assembly protein-like isoform X2 n=1 Tax=Lineus longissimus TaxID=88925 RepID=UPI002B4C34AB